MSQLPVLASSSTLPDICKLTVPVLRKYLHQSGLASTGAKEVLVKRLHASLRTVITPPRISSSDEELDDGDRAFTRLGSKSSSSHHHSARQRHHKESSSHRSKTGHKSSRKTRHPSHVSRTSSPTHSEDPRASTRGRHSRSGTQASAWDRARARSRSPTSIHHRHANLSSSSESRSDSSSTTRSHYRRRKRATSSSSSPSPMPPRPRYRKKHKQRRQHSSSSSESDSDVEPGPFVSFAPPPSRHCVQRIRRGKYIKFDHLLPSVDTIPFQSWHQKPSKHQHHSKRKVSDLQSWLQAWNIYMLVRIHTAPDTALDLAKYQTLMCHLFSSYPVSACLQYDKLFRHAAARDHTLAWDELKEDILIWCMTQDYQPFRRQSSILNRLGPLSASAGGTRSSDRSTHTTEGKEICRKFNIGKCTRGESCIFSHTCWNPGCLGSHSAKACTLSSKPSYP